MRAVNLIPAELRGGGRAPSRTGIAPYAVLGVLALLWVASLSLGLRRLDRLAVAPSVKPLRLVGALA